jgi:hypothetical protein
MDDELAQILRDLRQAADALLEGVRAQGQMIARHNLILDLMEFGGATEEDAAEAAGLMDWVELVDLGLFDEQPDPEPDTWPVLTPRELAVDYPTDKDDWSSITYLLDEVSGGGEL